MRTIVLGSLAVLEESAYWLKGVFRYFGAPLSTMRLKRKLPLTLNDVSMKYWGRDDIEIGRWLQSLRCADCVRTAMPRHLNEFTTKFQLRLCFQSRLSSATRRRDRRHDQALGKSGSAIGLWCARRAGNS